MQKIRVIGFFFENRLHWQFGMEKIIQQTAILVVNAITPSSCTIKLQYILLGDYGECVRPARLPVLT